jgi:hypothetical protein
MEKGGSKKSLRDLYPNLTQGQLREAEENLEKYLELTLRIYERIESDPTAYALFKQLIAERERPRGRRPEQS